MIRTIVFRRHTLGVVYPFGRCFYEIQILRSSILRGSPFWGDPITSTGTLMFDPSTDDFRAATERDFVEFGVMSHPDYFAEFVDPRLPERGAEHGVQEHTVQI